MSITLYWFWTTNPQKIRMALEELNLKYTLENIHLGQKKHLTEEYKQINPMQEVPALAIDGGILWQSGAALEYLAERERRLQPQDSFNGRNLLFLEASSVQRLAGVHFIQKKIRPLMQKKTMQDAINIANSKLQPIYAILDQQLQKHDYLCGDFSIVDCAYAPWLPYLDLENWDSLLEYRRKIKERDSWKSCGFRD
jgi:GST-like protein